MTAQLVCVGAEAVPAVHLWLRACALPDICMPTCHRAEGPTCQRALMPTYECANMPTHEHAIMLICQHVNVPSCQSFNTPTCQHANAPTCHAKRACKRESAQLGARHSVHLMRGHAARLHTRTNTRTHTHVHSGAHVPRLFAPENTACPFCGLVPESSARARFNTCARRAAAAAAAAAACRSQRHVLPTACAHGAVQGPPGRGCAWGRRWWRRHADGVARGAPACAQGGRRACAQGGPVLKVGLCSRWACAQGGRRACAPCLCAQGGRRACAPCLCESCSCFGGVHPYLPATCVSGMCTFVQAAHVLGARIFSCAGSL